MNRKYIQHFMGTGLKYFFDLDYTMVVGSLTLFLVIFGFIKLIGYWVIAELQDGLHTVKYDMHTLKEQAAGVAARLDMGDDNNIITYFRELKNNIFHKNLSA